MKKRTVNKATARSTSKKKAPKRAPIKARVLRKKPRENVAYPNVSRFDYSKGRGYSVRFSRTNETGARQETNRYFSDRLHGGSRAALAAAIRWRNETARKLPPPSRGGILGSPRPPGYSYIKSMHISHSARGVRREYLAYVGFLRIENRRHLSTRWSIEKWGKTIARRRCKEWLAKKKLALELRLMTAR